MVSCDGSTRLLAADLARYKAVVSITIVLPVSGIASLASTAKFMRICSPCSGSALMLFRSPAHRRQGRASIH